MLCVFLPPYLFRGIKAPYLWFFYKYIHCATEKILFITGDDYLHIANDDTQNDRWEYDPASLAALNYTVPDENSLSRHEYLYLDNNLYDELLSHDHKDPIQLFLKFLTERITSLETELTTLLNSRAGLIDEIDAFISICNCPSLEYVASTLGKAVMHVEIGPLRSPMYSNTGYLDFSGVNGGTEAKQRYQKCLSELDIDTTLADLHRFFLTGLPPAKTSPDYAVGAVLQVEDDSNLIAYNQGFSNISLISYMRQLYQKNTFLIRTHPGSLFQLRNNNLTIDDSTNSLDFINKCETILTINSSVGLEAILTGKKTTILGDSSYSFINKITDTASRINAAAFYLFSYLVPFELIFNQEYLNFRLANPEELEIVTKHIEFYADERQFSLPNCPTTLSASIIEVISQDKKMKNILEKERQEYQAQLDLLKKQLNTE
jgi:hypothetical protein